MSDILNFSGVLLIGMGGLFIFAAGLMILISLVNKNCREGLRNWVGGGWNVIGAWEDGNTIGNAFGWLNSLINKAVSKMILDYERSSVFGAIATSIFIVILPLAALVNTLQGGSPFMLYCYGFICLGVVYQLFAAEFKYNAVLRSATAGLSAFLLVFALPYYAAWSLTEYLMNQPVFLSVLASVLVANVLYAGTAGLGALVRTGNRTGAPPMYETFLAYILFAIPIYYVLYWLTIFAAEVAYDYAQTVHTPESLFVSVSVGALSFALVKLFLDHMVMRSLIVGVLGSVCLLGIASSVVYFGSFAVAGSEQPYGSGRLAHIPFIPFIGMGVLIAGTVLGSILLRANIAAKATGKRPVEALGLLLLIVGGLVILAGTGLR